jgi:hypothetical protein
VNGATLRFSEAFAAAFKTLVTPSPANNGLALHPPFAQNVPGTSYPSESAFIISAQGGTAGLTDSSTRFRAVFSGVPAGVNVYVTTTNYQGTGGSGLGTGTATGAGGALNPLANNSTASIAWLVQSETTPDSGGTAPTVSPTTTVAGNIALAQVNLVGGNGEAVWEVVSSNPNVTESFDFGVYFSYPAAGVATGTGRVDLSFAPVSTTSSIPRFTDNSTPANFVSVLDPPATVPVLSPFALLALAVLLATAMTLAWRKA